MQDDLIEIDPELLLRLDHPVPRYTSYPTAVHFQPLGETVYQKRLSQLKKEPLSIYIHIPFCRTMCLFCACSVVLNRDPKKQESYLHSLLLEIDLVFSEKREVSQLHLGGGTPTNLTEQELELLFSHIQKKVFFSQDAEISIEIDPRTVFSDQGRKLKFLKELGFNRISFGVQDADPKVQEAVRRRQSWEMTEQTFHLARELGFISINLDLIYGLPLQTPESFAETAGKIINLEPDRIALFSYARVPWLKAHQKAIQESSLPSTLDKFRIYVETRAKFMRAGYTAIGMDHFAKKEDTLTSAYLEKRLQRNFQGYSLQLAENIIGLGVTAIGYVEGCFMQNVKEISSYQKMLKEGHLPVFRGRELTEDDLIRRYVIQKIMCDFTIDKLEFTQKFSLEFDQFFASNKERKKALFEEGLLIENAQKLSATPLGRLFVRNIASLFDAYFAPSSSPSFSRAI